MKLIWTEGELGAGLRCHRAREFFAAHEHWESVWLRSKEPEKTFFARIDLSRGCVSSPSAWQIPRHSLVATEGERVWNAIRITLAALMGSLRKDTGEWLRNLEAGSDPRSFLSGVTPRRNTQHDEMRFCNIQPGSFIGPFQKKTDEGRSYKILTSRI